MVKMKVLYDQWVKVEEVVVVGEQVKEGQTEKLDVQLPFFSFRLRKCEELAELF